MSSATLLTSFRKLEKELSDTAIQKLLYLKLVLSMIKSYPEQSQLTHTNPTSGHFFDGQRVPMKHAALILRLLKNQNTPAIRLRPKNPEELVDFLDELWLQASTIALSDGSLTPDALKKKAQQLIEIGLQIAPSSNEFDVNSAPSFSQIDNPALTKLFEAAWIFGIEYSTFCLERI